MNIIKIIETIPDYEDEKIIELFNIIGDIKSVGYFNNEQAIKILKWKSPRPLNNYLSNSDKRFKEITDLAFKTKNEKLKIHILTALKGVNYPSASSLLMFYDKSIYPVID